MSNILIIDDDRELSQMLKEYLAPEGFDLKSVFRGDDGAQLAIEQNWDAIILDVMLPGMHGTAVLGYIRKHSTVPVLMLTAKGDDVDRILGLEMGADDYLPKPFNPRELAARLRAILRRQSNSEEHIQHSHLVCQSLKLWPGSRKVHIAGQLIELTSTQFNVLECLMLNAGEVVSKESLYETALGRPLAAHDRSIDMHISHLRKKMSQFDPNLIIHTIRGAGYQLEK